MLVEEASVRLYERGRAEEKDPQRLYFQKLQTRPWVGSNHQPFG